MKIDQTWYCKPRGIRERLTAGGVVVRRTPAGLMVALAREIDIDGWILPKGGVDPGEDLDMGARREIEEEAGLSELTLHHQLAVLERLESQRRFWSIFHYFLYETEQVQGTIKDLEHHPGMDWFPLDALPDMFWPDERAMIETHREAIRAAFLPRAD